MDIAKLRNEYHQRVCKGIIRVKKDKKSNYINFADKGSKLSREIAQGVVTLIGLPIGKGPLSGQTAGGRFERITKDFIQNVFDQLQHLRPGKWVYSTEIEISVFDQYTHLADLDKIIRKNRKLSSSIGGDYIIKPDIVVGRKPVSDSEINAETDVLDKENRFAKLTPFREANYEEVFPILHASISCKWTIRSDRAQNTRTEALNLIRNRKGHLPHVVAVTAEPLPTRLAALALGTGDLDCVYHFALPELIDTLRSIDTEEQLDFLMTMINGRRLRDISDLPFDLAI